jgi:hypothetical protein
VAGTNGSNPVFGPGLTVSGGQRSVYVEGGTSSPRLTASAGAPTSLRGSSLECVRVDSSSISDAPSIRIDSGPGALASFVTISDCGGFGGVVIKTAFGGTGSTIDRTIITRNSVATMDTGVVLLDASVVAITNSSISNLTGRGIEADDTSQLTVTGTNVTSCGTVNGFLPGGVVLRTNATATLTGSSIGRNTGHGIACADSALVIVKSSTAGGNTLHGISVSGGCTIDLDGVTASTNTLDGVHCEGLTKLKLRRSVTLANGNNGVFVGGSCAANLGAAGDLGANEYNRTSTRNTRSGLCLTTAATYDADGSSWSCDRGNPPGGCAGGTPTSPAVPPLNCATGVDYTATAGVVVSTSGATCCY